MKKCLIVVDYQNDFVSGSLGFSGAVALEQPIMDKIMHYRSNGDEVVFTFDTHDEGYLHSQEGRNLPIAHCLQTTVGHQLYGRIAALVSKSDKCFYKNTFGSDKLFDYLKQEPFKTIELVGVVSNICVISNAVLAKTAQPETPIIVDAQCTASNDDLLHRAALDVMSVLQIQVVNRQESK